MAWGEVNKSTIEPLTVVQKALMKIGQSKHRSCPAKLLFKETSILNMTEIYITNTIILTIIANKDSVNSQSVISFALEIQKILFHYIFLL